MDSPNKTASRRQGRKSQKKIIKKVVLGLLAVLLVSGAAGYFWAKSLENKMAFDFDINKEIEKVVDRPKGDEARNILLMGSDKRTSGGSSRADTIILARVDPKSDYTYMVSIPRDSYVSIPGRGKSKINHSYAWGGPALLIQTVEQFVNLPVHYYSEVDFNGFAGIVDELGGIDFEVEKGWHDKELNIDVRSGDRRRYGKEALAIVRGRSFPSGDFQRIKNQQKFLSAILKQSMGSLTDVRKITGLTNYSKTNMPVNDMLYLGRYFAGSKAQLQTTTLAGKTGMLNRVSYVFVDEKNKATVISLMKERKPFPE